MIADVIASPVAGGAGAIVVIALVVAGFVTWYLWRRRTRG